MLVVLTLITHNGVWDGIGTAAIGLLLVTIAIILAVETKSLLLGEGATPEDVRKIEEAVLDGAGVERIIHMKTLYLGPEELLVAAKIGVPGRRAIVRPAGADRSRAGRADVRGGVKIGLADLEVNDVPAFGLERPGADEDFEGRFRSQPLHP